jgi:small-conductance mechanosensitive channel
MNGEDTLLLGIHVGTAIASLITVALVAAAHIGLKWWSRRRTRRAASQPSITQWLTNALQWLVAPVALLLWIFGLHYALSALLSDLSYPVLARYGLPALNGLRGVGALLAVMWLLARVGRGVESALGALAARTEGRVDDFLLPIVGTGIRLILPLLAVIMGAPLLAVPERLQELFSNGVSMVLIGAFGYVLYRLVNAACELVLSRHRIDVKDNREARGIYTQVTVLRKAAIVIIVVFAFASMLMVFDSVRQVGTTILASAGVAGIVVGFAAQRSIATLLAGFQIAMTQPIRLDDVVIVEGEWGRIEEITLTYVVVGIWDQRRLVVPITYFLDKPFQNWTRTSAELLAYVYLQLDYRVPLQRVREKFSGILKSSPHWDGRVNRVQVTDTSEHAVQVRLLASAADASHAWDLRCAVREQMLTFLQQEYPESLPRLRLEQERSAAA